MRLNQVRPALAVLGLFGALAATPALADGYPPYFGFSGYFGGPATFYTPDTDVQQTTRLEAGSSAFGTRTYTAGGPFWHYKPSRSGGFPGHRRVRYVRVKG